MNSAGDETSFAGDKYEELQLELELEAYLPSYPPSLPISIPPSSMTSEAMDMLLSSTLLMLSPAEMKRARHASYPIFKDNSRDMDRFSYLFDEIPFGLETPVNRKKLMGTHEVFHHDEKIDWGALEGWEVEGTKRPYYEGSLIIGRAAKKSNYLGGRLFFFPEEGENDEYSQADESTSDLSTDIEVDYDDQSWESEENESINESDDEVDVEDEGEESDDRSQSESERMRSWRRNWIEHCSLLHFDERRFDLDRDYENASWFASGSECDFGLINPLSNGEDPNDDAGEAKNSVTVFKVNESMAFARGDKQRFVSLEDPSNYGSDCGSNYEKLFFPTHDKTHQMNMMERMQAYRGSWICKLCPSITIPEVVAHLIWEYWQTGPPPFLFVERGDLLLLARCEETVPDPDFPDNLIATVTREHLVLARPGP